jgi:pimeloyl-ACP methyl ester carboxylesterase
MAAGSLLLVIWFALRRRPREAALLTAAALLAVLAPSGSSFAQSASVAVPPAEVYVFRPMGGKAFSKEMDNLATRIEAEGLAVEVYNYTGYTRPAKEAIKRYRDQAVKTRIIAIGHSAGGDSAIRFALALKKANVPVDLIITLDPTRIANRVPANVGRFVNIYSSEHTFGGGDPKPAADFAGHFASIDLKDYSDIWHIYMTGMATLQDAVVAKIMEVLESPALPADKPVAIEYVLPKDSPFELWDSGVAVIAGAGDTAASVAAQFGVPAWAVASINEIAADAPLAAGQRLVVPRRVAAAGPSN